ncbi:MAG TPA: TetR/AcrR family transcriptional regulator [Kineosporiaceae bacterium]|nr:TetR/AcrR family transcriptional regulator [Kineosporiaceae bacterium]
MAGTQAGGDPAFEDLTARARIRQAALAQFTAHGFERTTIRGIAGAAGVSPGLVRHHFGSKQELRDTVDAHILKEIRRLSDLLMAGSRRGELDAAVVSREAVRPFQAYLARALAEGSTTLETLFDEMVTSTETFLALPEENGHADEEPHFVDRRTRAAVCTAMALGVPLLQAQLSRVLGVDITSPAGDRQVALALLDIYAHALMSPELAHSARDALLATPLPAEP